MVEWVLQDEETNWLKLEEQSCPLVPMETIPFLEQKKWRKLQIKNEWMNCTKRVWSLVRKKIGAPLTTSRAVKIAKDIDFLPCRLDVGFRGWMEKGLININQLFDGGTLKSFTQLQDKYGLTSKDFYRYLQLRNYLITHKEWNMLKQPPTPIEEFLITNMKEKNTRKIVSELYKCLQTHWSLDSLHIKDRWELEMNVIIEDEEWREVCESGHKLTNCPIWKEFNWKIKMRYFKTPSITSTFDERNNNLCWRNCGKIGDHTHFGTVQN